MTYKATYQCPIENCKRELTYESSDNIEGIQWFKEDAERRLIVSHNKGKHDLSENKGYVENELNDGANGLR